MKVDNSRRERLYMRAHGTEYQNRLAVLNKTPCGRKTEFTQILRKRRGPFSDRRNPGSEKPWDKGSFVADPQIQATGVADPHDLAIAQSCRPPLVLDQTARLVTSKPVGEIFKLLALGQHR